LYRLFLILALVFVIAGCGKEQSQSEPLSANTENVTIQSSQNSSNTPQAQNPSDTPQAQKTLTNNQNDYVLSPVDEIRASAASIEEGMSCQDALASMPEPQSSNNGMYVWNAKDGGGFVLICSDGKVTDAMSVITDEQFSKIQNGMDCSEVIKSLGNPTTTVKYETGEALAWNIANSDIKGVAYCVNGKITKTERSNDIHEPTDN